MAKAKVDLMLVVRGDHNDADFITKLTPITEKDLARFMPLIAAIKKFKPYKGMTDEKAHGLPSSEWSHDNNWPCGEYGCREDLGEKPITELYKSDTISEDLITEFDETYVPHAEGWNLHTIYEIYTVRFEKKLLNAGSPGWSTV